VIRGTGLLRQSERRKGERGQGRSFHKSAPGNFVHGDPPAGNRPMLTQQGENFNGPVA
jgi:hypothetical protein